MAMFLSKCVFHKWNFGLPYVQTKPSLLFSNLTWPLKIGGFGDDRFVQIKPMSGQEPCKNYACVFVVSFTLVNTLSPRCLSRLGATVSWQPGWSTNHSEMPTCHRFRTWGCLDEIRMKSKAHWSILVNIGQWPCNRNRFIGGTYHI